MRLTEACTHTVLPNGDTYAEADISRSDTHYDREQCAKDLLGTLAQGATPYGRSMGKGENRFIVVRKKGEITSRFYEAARIEKPEDAPAGTIAATHHYYNSAIGHGGISKETHYAIMPVEPHVADRLRLLGL